MRINHKSIHYNLLQHAIKKLTLCVKYSPVKAKREFITVPNAAPTKPHEEVKRARQNRPKPHN